MLVPCDASRHWKVGSMVTSTRSTVLYKHSRHTGHDWNRGISGRRLMFSHSCGPQVVLWLSMTARVAGS